ncbi:H(+)/Cl(-) exchange transporter ClcA [Gimesia alba]|uniref:H(+)/Cl(-) exchange transporter ClcA n=1 Tax=Gimesia alba TaxID=2527973 RepID=A0A517RF21_9PLAN|nr:chloride channel protein [Gimesia alba]QDT42482.1 H(+)/Cl(-) exchange transporter ClcA [Gimesia alba]
MTYFKTFGQFLTSFDLKTNSKWFVLSVLIGVVAGLGAIVFDVLTQVVQHNTLVSIAGFDHPQTVGEHSIYEDSDKVTHVSPWLMLVVVTAGGLASGLIVYNFAPEAEGHGTDAAIDAFHNKRGIIQPRVPIIKTIASALTLGTGGSGGREGPIAQIGAGFGSWVAGLLKLSARDRRIMLAAGVGAGIGGIFRAPLAGALFAAEILYSNADFESDVIVPAAMSSIIAYSVYCLSLPQHLRFMPLFGDSLHHTVDSHGELIPYTILSIVLSLAAIFYVKTFYGTNRIFKSLPVKPMFRPAIGALLTGLVGIGMYFLFEKDIRALSVMSTGYGVLQDALTSAAGLSIPLLLTIAFVKVFTTSFTIASGGSGGVFGPSMVIGGCVGTATGRILQQLWPELVTQPEAYGLVGMAGFFAGAAHAPISTIIMVSEITGNYSLLLPTMLASTLCFVLCQKVHLYQKQYPSRLESPAHRGDFLVDVLEGSRVSDVFDPERKIQLIHESKSLDEIVHSLAGTQQHYFPVVDDTERIIGIFSEDDVRAYLYDETIWKLAVARDIMQSDFVKVSPDDDLNTVMQRFTSINVEVLPVVDEQDPGILLGMLNRKETIGYYNQQLMKCKRAGEECDE